MSSVPAHRESAELPGTVKDVRKAVKALVDWKGEHLFGLGSGERSLVLLFNMARSIWYQKAGCDVAQTNQPLHDIRRMLGMSPVTGKYCSIWRKFFQAHFCDCGHWECLQVAEMIILYNPKTSKVWNHCAKPAERHVPLYLDFLLSLRLADFTRLDLFPAQTRPCSHDFARFQVNLGRQGSFSSPGPCCKVQVLPDIKKLAQMQSDGSFLVRETIVNNDAGTILEGTAPRPTEFVIHESMWSQIFPYTQRARLLRDKGSKHKAIHMRSSDDCDGDVSAPEAFARRHQSHLPNRAREESGEWSSGVAPSSTHEIAADVPRSLAGSPSSHTQPRSVAAPARTQTTAGNAAKSTPLPLPHEFRTPTSNLFLRGVQIGASSHVVEAKPRRPFDAVRDALDVAGCTEDSGPYHNDEIQPFAHWNAVGECIQHNSYQRAGANVFSTTPSHGESISKPKHTSVYLQDQVDARVKNALVRETPFSSVLNRATPQPATHQPDVRTSESAASGQHAPWTVTHEDSTRIQSFPAGIGNHHGPPHCSATRLDLVHSQNHLSLERKGLNVTQAKTKRRPKLTAKRVTQPPTRTERHQTDNAYTGIYRYMRNSKAILSGPFPDTVASLQQPDTHDHSMDLSDSDQRLESHAFSLHARPEADQTPTSQSADTLIVPDDGPPAVNRQQQDQAPDSTFASVHNTTYHYKAQERFHLPFHGDTSTLGGHQGTSIHRYDTPKHQGTHYATSTELSGNAWPYANSSNRADLVKDNLLASISHNNGDPNAANSALLSPPVESAAWGREYGREVTSAFTNESSSYGHPADSALHATESLSSRSLIDQTANTEAIPGHDSAPKSPSAVQRTTAGVPETRNATEANKSNYLRKFFPVTVPEEPFLELEKIYVATIHWADPSVCYELLALSPQLQSAVNSASERNNQRVRLHSELAKDSPYIVGLRWEEDVDRPVAEQLMEDMFLAGRMQRGLIHKRHGLVCHRESHMEVEEGYMMVLVPIALSISHKCEVQSRCRNQRYDFIWSTTKLLRILGPATFSTTQAYYFFTLIPVELYDH